VEAVSLAQLSQAEVKGRASFGDRGAGHRSRHIQQEEDILSLGLSLRIEKIGHDGNRKKAGLLALAMRGHGRKLAPFGAPNGQHDVAIEGYLALSESHSPLAVQRIDLNRVRGALDLRLFAEVEEEPQGEAIVGSADRWRDPVCVRDLIGRAFATV